MNEIRAMIFQKALPPPLLPPNQVIWNYVIKKKEKKKGMGDIYNEKNLDTGKCAKCADNSYLSQFF